MGAGDELDRAAAAAGFSVPMPEGYEQKLVARLKRRDEGAFNELVRLYEGRVYRLVLRMLGDPGEAEDLAQEVFVTVFKSIDGFRGDSQLSTWLYRVASNHCKNRIKYFDRRARGAKREFDETTDGQAPDGPSTATMAQLPRPDAMAEGYEAESLLEQALRSLPNDQRELVVLRDLESLSYDEIQQVTGLARGTVKSRLHRARLALQQHMAQKHAEGRTSDGPGPDEAASVPSEREDAK